MVGGTRKRPVWSHSHGSVDGRKTAKNGNGAKCVVLLGEARAWDDCGCDIKKTEHHLLNDKRVRGARPTNCQRARAETYQ